MIKWLANAWRNLSHLLRRRDKPFKLFHLEELPEKPQQGTIYAIGEGTPWALALLCPCRCGALIQLSLLKDERPSWKMRLDRKGRPTLTPSVWRTAGCRSHFLVREGRVIWCGSR
jgi:Family of unknown function (DUF6527)